MTEKKVSGFSSGLSFARDNPWMVSTVVMGVLFLVALFYATSNAGFSGTVVSEREIGTKVVAALNAQAGGGVTLGSVAQEGSLYKVTVNYQGDSVPVYATLDGTQLAFQVIALDGTQPTPTPNVPSAPTVVTIDPAQIANAPVKGEANAPVTLVVFSDFQCPFCERFYADALPQIESQYVATGKVKLVFMNFPLSFHPEAQKAAESALCVRAQKGDAGFWAMHDLLFENQAELSTANYKAWARTLGVNGARFDSCLDDGTFAQQVADEEAYGSSLGVSGTPTSFVNGVEVVGAQPFSGFQQAIEAALAG